MTSLFLGDPAPPAPPSAKRLLWRRGSVTFSLASWWQATVSRLPPLLTFSRRQSVVIPWISNKRHISPRILLYLNLQEINTFLHSPLTFDLIRCYCYCLWSMTSSAYPAHFASNQWGAMPAALCAASFHPSYVIQVPPRRPTRQRNGGRRGF